MTMHHTTRFGSLTDYTKGGVELIDDSPKNYVFSNIYDVCAAAAPYDRVAVAKNFEYVIEAARAEGTSGWFVAPHDEFVLCMDGQVEVHLLKLDDPADWLAGGEDGAHAITGMPEGRKMGRLVLGRGHQGLLPAGCAYRFQADTPAALMIQTVAGPLTIERWPEICQVDDSFRKG